MKKIISILLSLLMLASFSASAHPDITVLIEGEPLEFDTKPVIVNSRTMVPMRAIFEALGATVTWDADARRVEGLFDDGTHIVLTIDSASAYKNGELKVLDAPAYIQDNRTMVPLRFISESSGAYVGWDGETYTVSITPMWQAVEFIPFGEFMSIPSPMGASSDFKIETYEKSGKEAFYVFDASNVAKEKIMLYKLDLIRKGFELVGGNVSDAQCTFYNGSYVLKTTEEDGKLSIHLYADSKGTTLNKEQN